MRVLIACEFSGIVRDAFKFMGHDAWSCDLLPTEREGQHIQGDVLDVLGDGWDLMIAHPPCTYLSNAGAKHLYKGGILNVERYKKGLEAKDFFLFLLGADIPKIAVENPIPSKIYELPRYSQQIQPFQFGHKVQKKTRLWLKNLPLLEPMYVVSASENCHDAGTWFMRGGKNRSRNRSRTFVGIAAAMAIQWGTL